MGQDSIAELATSNRELKSMLEELQAEFDQYRESSAELENELENELERVEARARKTEEEGLRDAEEAAGQQEAAAHLTREVGAKRDRDPGHACVCSPRETNYFVIPNFCRDPCLMSAHAKGVSTRPDLLVSFTASAAHNRAGLETSYRSTTSQPNLKQHRTC